MNSVKTKFGEYGLAPVLLVSVGFLSLLHAQLEGEAGEGFLCGVLAEPRPLFFSDPASSFHPCFSLRAPLEGVSIFHVFILAQAASQLPRTLRRRSSQNFPCTHSGE
jgi:hypothetical protein